MTSVLRGLFAGLFFIIGIHRLELFQGLGVVFAATDIAIDENSECAIAVFVKERDLPGNVTFSRGFLDNLDGGDILGLKMSAQSVGAVQIEKPCAYEPLGIRE